MRREGQSRAKAGWLAAFSSRNTKQQTTNTNELQNLKLQKRRGHRFCDLRVESYLVFGVWGLVFHFFINSNTAAVIAVTPVLIVGSGTGANSGECSEGKGLPVRSLSFNA